MRKLTLLAATLLISTSVAAQQANAKLEKIAREALPVCQGLQFTTSELGRQLPSGFQGTVFSSRSTGGYCDGDQVVVTTSTGFAWVGGPWFLDGEGTPEQRLERIAWEALRDHVKVELAKEPTREGLVGVTLWSTTARGRVPLVGTMDREGKVFFMGSFRPMKENYAASRLEALKPFLASAPAKGPADAPVTIIEFSDFECPSCKRSSDFASQVVAAHPDKVRYIRFDMPLVSMHPWALTATMAGRAVHKQKPERFWDYKALIYENQDKLNAFVIDDFVTGFARDIELDLEKFNADFNSEATKNEVLRGVGYAMSNDVRATPTFMVNGMIVEPGEGGKLLKEYVAGLLK